MKHPEQKRVQWAALLTFLALLPFVVRGTSLVRQDALAKPAAATPPAEVLHTGPISPFTEGPAPTQTPAPLMTPLPENPPDTSDDDGFIFLNDAHEGQPASQAFAALEASPSAAPSAAPEAEPTPENTPNPDRWLYESDTITVDISRHKISNFVYFAADIQISRPEQFWYAFSGEKYGARTEALSDIAERHDPMLAINGDFYGFHDNGIIIRGGELFRKNKSARQLLIVDANGDLRVMTDRSEKQAVVAANLLDEGVLHTFEFGPMLVKDGEQVKLNSAILRVEKGYREPRTAIGQLGPLHYLVIVVDGRSKGYSEGCDLPELQDIFMQHGVSLAFNLDGGGSTTLWFNGEIINQPSAGEERQVSDIVMFMRD